MSNTGSNSDEKEYVLNADGSILIDHKGVSRSSWIFIYLLWLLYHHLIYSHNVTTHITNILFTGSCYGSTFSMHQATTE